MSSEFTEFTEAVSRNSGDQSDAAPGTSPGQPLVPVERIAVLGGGADARLLAALCLAENTRVTLFSAYGAELDEMRNASGITLRGSGPVGTYQVDNDSITSIQTTAELDRAVADAEIIFLTGPVHKQRTYAMVLASHLHDGQIIVLAPGRSLGALETAWYLRIGGSTADVTVVETQGLPYWYDVNGSQLNLSSNVPVAAATLPSGRVEAIAKLSVCLPNLQPVDSVLWSGFADGSALVELPALLLNGPAMGDGSPFIPMGGQALPENHTFASLIGEEQRIVIDQLATERRDVARAFGVRNLPSTDDWIKTHAGTLRGEGSRSVPDKAQALTLQRDGVIGSLVPLISAADLCGKAVPVTQSLVTLVASMLGADIAAAGRRLDTIGIDATDVDSARKTMDNIALGNR